MGKFKIKQLEHDVGYFRARADELELENVRLKDKISDLSEEKKKSRTSYELERENIRLRGEILDLTEEKKFQDENFVCERIHITQDEPPLEKATRKR
ncbi:hypothetical protein Tsubulata_021540 [Turnera subulata]|uniref:Uncharacterized protein n=1 Tax=Turnera subulata TaxID=218843 RepID=A0A9Q0GB54_9ROSI|nr:hypothetical protein Tsubulata_021540 [Turnera subulata]